MPIEPRTTAGLTIRYTDNAWESFYGILEELAVKGLCVQVTTKDGSTHDGTLDPIEGDLGDMWNERSKPKIVLRQVPGGPSMPIIAEIPLYVGDGDVNIVNILVY